MDPANDWMPESDLVDTILGKFTGNHKVWLGQAFGAVLEQPSRYRVNAGYRVTPRGTDEIFEFADEVMDPALALIDRPRTVFEAKGIGQFCGHDVVAKADQLVGADLIETKTTLSTFDFDKYAASCQWRFMADIFGVSRITYHVFCLYENQAGVVELKSTETFHFFPYAELRADCEALVRDFVSYVEARGLRAELDARQAQFAGAL